MTNRNDAEDPPEWTWKLALGVSGIVAVFVWNSNSAELEAVPLLILTFALLCVTFTILFALFRGAARFHRWSLGFGHDDPSEGDEFVHEDEEPW